MPIVSSTIVSEVGGATGTSVMTFSFDGIPSVSFNYNHTTKLFTPQGLVGSVELGLDNFTDQVTALSVWPEDTGRAFRFLVTNLPPGAYPDYTLEHSLDRTRHSPVSSVLRILGQKLVDADLTGSEVKTRARPEAQLSVGGMRLFVDTFLHFSALASAIV